MARWNVSGQYIEACSCEAVCPCVVFSPPTDGVCTAVVGWRIDKGHHDGVSLDGLNVSLMAHAVGNMANGNWKVALYTDDRASPQQRAALEAIFSGAAGGHLAALGPLIGEVLGVKPAKITFAGSGKEFKLTVEGISAFALKGIVGQNDGPVQITGHPLAPVPNVPFTVARSEHFRYGDHGITCEVTNKNAFFAPFSYQP